VSPILFYLLHLSTWVLIIHTRLYCSLALIADNFTYN